MKLTAEEKQFFRERGFQGPTDYSVAKIPVAPRFTTRYIQARGAGWQAIEAPDWGDAWRSAVFPDPISCYINAELQQWQS